MADGATNRSRNLPNFFSAAGKMDAYSGGDKGSQGSQGSAAADSGDKVKQVSTLLEVVRKLDSMETDPENKKLTQQVVSLVEQYMQKLQPSGGTAAGTSTGETGAATPTGAGAAPPTGGATAPA